MATVKLNVATIGSSVIYTQYSGTVVPASDGTVTVDTRDVKSLLSAGAVYVNARAAGQFVSIPAVGTAAAIVSSVALANGTLTIAAQPDVPRQLGLRVDPGSGTITAGSGVITYVANDGTTTIDTIALSTAALFTTNTSKGVCHLTSAVISGLTGGSSPKVQMDTTNYLACMVDTGYTDFLLLKANIDSVDNAGSTVATAAACVSPSTAPNGTHNYSFYYSYLMPNS